MNEWLNRIRLLLPVCPCRLPSHPCPTVLFWVVMYKSTERGERVSLGKQKSSHSPDWFLGDWEPSPDPTGVRGIPLGQQDHNPPKPPDLSWAVKHRICSVSQPNGFLESQGHLPSDFFSLEPARKFRKAVIFQHVKQIASFEAQTSLFFHCNKHLRTNRTMGSFALTNQTQLNQKPKMFFFPWVHFDGMDFVVN